jgi:acetyl-CoA synthetase
MGPWMYGSPILVYEGEFEPERVYDLLERYEVTNFFTVPTGYRMLREFDSNPLETYDIDLRNACTGGEPLPAEIFDWAREQLDVKVNELYGQTETYVSANYPAVETKPGSAGLPLPGYDIAVVDDDYEELPPGEIGEVAVSPDHPAYFIEYWGKPEATDAVRKNGWHLTGDAGRFDEDGYLWIEGRVDDVIISSGYRIGPYEVESTVEKHEGVSESAVVGIPDDQRGEIVKAFVNPAPDTEPSDELEADIQEFVKDELAAYEYPREIEFVDEFERTVSDKIKRAELKPDD